MQERVHDKASRTPVKLAEWAQDHQLPDTQGLPVPLGDRLRTFRKERGWSQDDLAQAIGAAGANNSAPPTRTTPGNESGSSPSRTLTCTPKA